MGSRGSERGGGHTNRAHLGFSDRTPAARTCTVGLAERSVIPLGGGQPGIEKVLQAPGPAPVPPAKCNLGEQVGASDHLNFGCQSLKRTGGASGWLLFPSLDQGLGSVEPPSRFCTTTEDRFVKKTQQISGLPGNAVAATGTTANEDQPTVPLPTGPLRSGVSFLQSLSPAWWPSGPDRCKRTRNRPSLRGS